MSKGRLLAAALALGVCASCGSDPTAPSGQPAGESGAVIVLTGANFGAQVLGSDAAWMVEFYSPGCPHCQSMTTIVTTLAADFRGRASVGKVDTDVEAGLVRTYQIEAVPTFVFFKRGKEVSRQVGTASYSSLAGMLDSTLAAP
jgi:thioredoxin 1